MAFSKEKAFDRAERYAAKGQHDKAAREYQAIVDNDPKEIRAWLMLADCLVRCGNAQHAIERYLQVGGYYIQEKDHKKALAVYRQVLNLDAGRIDVQLRVAALNQELGRTQDAVAMYERVAGLQMQAGKTVDALQTYKIVADVDPTAVSRRLRLAELYSREKRGAEAVDAFRAAGEQLLAQDRKADFVRVAERLLYHQGSDLATVRRLASIYLELGDPRRALMKLNGLLHIDAGDRVGIELLAQTFMALGKPDKAVSAIAELARALKEAGGEKDLAEAARVVNLGLSWVPGEPGLAAARADLQRATPAAPASAPAAAAAPSAGDSTGPVEAIEVEADDIVELDDGDLELEEVDESDTFVPEPAAQTGATIVPLEVDVGASTDAPAIELDSPAQPSMTASVLSEASQDDVGAVDPEALTDFDKILFEARVYIKYRLFDHALDHVAVALGQQPAHVGALTLMTRALTELNRNVEAADAHAQIATLVLASDRVLAGDHVAEALALTPGHVKALQVQRRIADDLGPAVLPAHSEPLLVVDVQDESAANLEPVHHDAGEEADFTIEVDMADDASDDSLSTAPLEIEDRFGLSGEHDAAAFTDPEATGEFDPVVADEAILVDDADAGFDAVVAEVAEHGERANIELLEPSVDTGVLSLNDHVEPGGELHPGAGASPTTAEPDLLSLSIGKDQARALEPDVDLPLGDGYVEQDGVPTPVSVASGTTGALPVDLDVPGAPLDEESPTPTPVAPTPVAPTPVAPTPVAPTPVAVAPASAEPAKDWPDISDDVAEVQFYLDQGLDDDAEAAVEDLKERYPGHPALAAFGAEPEPEPEPEPVVEPPSEPAVELSAAPQVDAPVVPLERGASAPLVALSDDDEDDDDYLAAIFGDPEPSTAEPAPKSTGGARVATDDVDPQSSFDLGVAYCEMGLVDQAVSQFEAAATDERLRPRALVMLGSLRLQQGNAPDAIKTLEEAVSIASNTDEAAEANYELGLVYEKIGETGKAIARLSAVAEGYRDRDERLGQLRG